MIRVGFLRAVCLCGLCLGLSGCFSSSRSQLDEEKEPYFLAGKSRETAMDFDGAIESYEKAVEVNPHNSAAHFELGFLYERNDNDCAAAIYHYDRFLALRPDSDNAEVIRQHILGCKQVLARTVSLGPITEAQTHELNKVVEENKSL
ncbi:MAG TPA: tetratricopeptide repeat protein, partial [Verrucomicrobiae bacterium]|nr:tetratricopeptide repeat protein [Verrucomicrobiae bacterium]